MLEVIEKLLILQDRDQKIQRLTKELSRIEPDRQALLDQSASAQAAQDAAKLRVKQLESDRKKLELDVEAKKQLIGKYSLQQFQTKKNEEYRALAHEIETCKAAIITLEDQEIELMEQTESAQKQVVATTRDLDEVKKVAQAQIKDLGQREANLKSELAELEGNRKQLTVDVDEGTLTRYERLFKHKGDHVIVGIPHGVCGGCHMRFPTHLVIACQTAKEIVTCPNCNRILYYTRDMDLAIVD